MTHRSKMDQDVVNSVLRQNVFDGLNKIDYNTFRKAVQNSLLDFENRTWGMSSDFKSFPLGYFLTEEGGPRTLSVTEWSLYNPTMPDRATAFGNAIEEARLKKIGTQMASEVKNLKS